ncbi:MAG: hypothetical protein N838_17345 [Thiohalocapsa sp. PB-PSB1]|jgi:hypothetical protein|nr:MAG: hypothetical protein N838_17345 [Thiohalocapsa sp. PB-PSB1]
MKFDAYALKAAPIEHQVSRALMSCLFDSDSDPDSDSDQVALGGLQPGGHHLSGRPQAGSYGA